MSWRTQLVKGNVFSAEIRLALGHICQRGGDEHGGGWLDPLFDSAAEVVAEIEKGFEHAGIVSEYLVNFSA